MDGSILYQPVLVLNAAMVPVEIISVRRAIVDILRQIAVPVTETSQAIRSPSIQIKVPRIIAYTRYSKIPRPHIALNRWNVLQRDQMTCAYCNQKFPRNQLTVDHVIPRSRWQQIMGHTAAHKSVSAKNNKVHAHTNDSFHSWENVVTACRSCNFRKGNRLLSELGWRLRFQPGKPDWLPQIVISREQAVKMGWLEYCSYNVYLVDAA